MTFRDDCQEMEVGLRNRMVLGNKFLAGLAESYGPARVAQAAWDCLGYPPNLVTSHKEANEVLKALEDSDAIQTP